MMISVKKYRWQCIECKCCSVCGNSDNDVSNFKFRFNQHRPCLLFQQKYQVQAVIYSIQMNSLIFILAGNALINLRLDNVFTLTI